MNLDYISNKLRELRYDNKWTQDDLADKLKVSRQAISNWERGFSLPNIEALLDLSKLFHISINELLEPPLYLISDFEDILSIERELIKTVLSAYNIEDVVIALKGASPLVNDLINDIYPEIDFECIGRLINKVKVSDVEDMQEKITMSINDELLSKCFP